MAVPSGFSGAVLVARGSTILLSRGFGGPRSAPYSPGTRFWIASAGKQFVAAAIFKLAEAGKLRLDDPLKTYFPAAPADKAAITIRQLLSHTSGFGQSYVSEEKSSRNAAVAAMLAEPLVAAPGSGFHYSNSNIQLAAAIVEIASGQPYTDYVRDALWQPAKLISTNFAGSAGAASVAAIDGDLPKRLKGRFWGEQGVYSSAADLFRWTRALDRGVVLKRHTVAIMFAPVSKITEGYTALGWFRGTTPKGNDFIFVRGNEDFGANSLIYLFPRQHVTIIVLTHGGDRGEQSWSRAVLADLETQLGL